MCVKKGVVKTLGLRVNRLCSSDQTKNAELIRLISVFEENNYPRYLIKKLLTTTSGVNQPSVHDEHNEQPKETIGKEPLKQFGRS